MRLDYSQGKYLALLFDKDELCVALTVLQFIFSFTKSKVVNELIGTLRNDLTPKLPAPKSLHICEKCCIPIKDDETEYVKDGGHFHLKCPELKPDALRGG